MKIDDKMIDYVAALAKLELSDNGSLTRESARADLEKILAYMEIMEELNTDKIEPMSHVLPLQNVVREDVVQQEPEQSLGEREQLLQGREQLLQRREQLLSNAPVQKEGCFVVPKTVE